MDYQLHRVRARDWREFRTIRLEMLRDTPSAYLETLEAAREHPDGEWRFRADRASGHGNIAVAAVDREGAWVGTMSGFLPRPEEAKLVGVWLHPAHRGRGGAAALMLGEIVRWAREEGAGRLVLLVHEDNHRALAFYRRHGFATTGRSVPYPLDETRRELEMTLPLAPRPGRGTAADSGRGAGPA